MRKSPKRCISQSISQVFTSLPSRVAIVPFHGDSLWTQENKTKRKSAMLVRQVSRKIEKSKHRCRWCGTPTNAKIRIPKVGKIQQGKSEKTQRKKAGGSTAARVSGTPRQSNGDVSRTEKEKKSRWSAPRDAKSKVHN